MQAKQKAWKASQHNHLRSLAIWTFGWLITMAISSFGPKFFWDFDELFSTLAIVLNLAVGAGMILANMRHLRSLDELDRKISLEAMGISLGVTVVGGLAYSTLDTANVIAADAEISVLVVLTSLSYLAALFINRGRYQ